MGGARNDYAVHLVDRVVELGDEIRELHCYAASVQAQLSPLMIERMFARLTPYACAN